MMNNGDVIALNGVITRCMTGYNSRELYRVRIGNKEIWFSKEEIEKAKVKIKK